VAARTARGRPAKYSLGRAGQCAEPLERRSSVSAGGRPPGVCNPRTGCVRRLVESCEQAQIPGHSTVPLVAAGADGARGVFAGCVPQSRAALTPDAGGGTRGRPGGQSMPQARHRRARRGSLVAPVQCAVDPAGLTDSSCPVSGARLAARTGGRRAETPQPARAAGGDRGAGARARCPQGASPGARLGGLSTDGRKGWCSVDGDPCRRNFVQVGSCLGSHREPGGPG